VTAISLDGLPRTLSRTQPMDALSSQSNVAGYKAALVAAAAFGRFFPMLITAAGTARPAKVLVLGAGVAGLQAIGTARRLGAVVSGYDVRPASKTRWSRSGPRSSS
jgi:NAD(P) transhydrogenase subunit alpha